MGLQAGNNCVVKLTDNGDTERTLTAYVTKVAVDLKGHGLVDVTVMSNSGHKWASDELEDNSFIVDFLFDSAANAVWAVLCSSATGLRTATAAKAFEIGPQGSTGGYPKITGNCWLEAPPLDVSVGDMIRMNGVSFKVDGTVTIATY